jgi:hypothetical protein
MNLDSREGATTRLIVCHGCGRTAIADVVVGSLGELRHWAEDPADAVRQVRVSHEHGWGTIDRLARLVPGGARMIPETSPRDERGLLIRYCPECLAIVCPPLSVTGP